MFSKITRISKTPQAAPPRSTSSALIEISQFGEAGMRKYSYFGPSLHAKGDFTVEEDLRIEGRLEGTITVKGKKLEIGKQARVAAQVHARAIDVRGTIEGDLHGDELVHLFATAVVNGTVHCGRIVIDDGARLNGQVHMPGVEKKVGDKPKLTPVGGDLASAAV